MSTVNRGDFGPRGDFGQFWKLHSMIISGFIFEFEMNWYEENMRLSTDFQGFGYFLDIFQNSGFFRARKKCSVKSRKKVPRRVLSWEDQKTKKWDWY